MKKVFLIMLVIFGFFANFAYSAVSCGSTSICGYVFKDEAHSIPLTDAPVTAYLINNNGEREEAGSGLTDSRGYFNFSVGSYSTVRLAVTTGPVGYEKEYDLGWATVGLSGEYAATILMPLIPSTTSNVDPYAPRTTSNGEPMNIVWKVNSKGNMTPTATIEWILSVGGWTKPAVVKPTFIDCWNAVGPCLARCSEIHYETFTFRSLTGCADYEVYHVRGWSSTTNYVNGQAHHDRLLIKAGWPPAEHQAEWYDKAAAEVKNITIKGINNIRSGLGSSVVEVAGIKNEYLTASSGVVSSFFRYIISITNTNSHSYYPPDPDPEVPLATTLCASSPRVIGNAHSSSNSHSVKNKIVGGKKLSPIDFAVFGKSYVEIGQGAFIFGSVGTHADSLVVKSNANIHGDVALIVGEENQPRIIDTGTIRGEVVKLPDQVWLPSLKVPDGVLIKDEYTGGQLSAGVHAFKKLDLKGNAVISATDSVVIYVTESLNITGDGELKVREASKSLIIFGTESLKEVEIRGNKHINGVIYAPDAKITVSGNAVVYGTVVGNEVVYRR